MFYGNGNLINCIMSQDETNLDFGRSRISGFAAIVIVIFIYTDFFYSWFPEWTGE